MTPTIRPVALTLIGAYMMIVSITGTCISSTTVVVGGLMAEPSTTRYVITNLSRELQTAVNIYGVLLAIAGIFGLVLSIGLLVSALGLWNLRRWSYETSILSLGMSVLLSLVGMILARPLIIPAGVNAVICSVAILLMLSDRGISNSLGVS
jgi:hypothetical protein